MSSIENNNEDWKEMRARIDSIATAVFLIGGGSLSLSITVILSNLKKLNISTTDLNLIESAWKQLSLTIALVLFLKMLLVFQCFMLQVKTGFMDKHFMKFNWAVLVIGTSSFCLFCNGLYSMILATSNIINA